MVGGKSVGGVDGAASAGLARTSPVEAEALAIVAYK
jgi:hypothetical protein